MKILVIALSLVVGALGVLIQPQSKNTAYYSQNIGNLAGFNLSDYYIRTQYWYYLRNANILFSTDVVAENRVIYFIAYRNMIGTFLAISSMAPATPSKV